MEINEMHLALDLGLQRMGSSVFDDILPEEKDIYLNDVIRKYVRVQRDLMFSDNTDQSSRSTENISPLLKTGVYNGDTTVHPREYTLDLPENLYLFGLGKVTTGSVGYDLRLVGLHIYSKYLDRSRGRQIYHVVPAVQLGRQLKFVLPSQTKEELQAIEITYLKKPNTVNYETGISCDLPDYTHQEIVDMTVEVMWEDIQRRDGKQI